MARPGGWISAEALMPVPEWADQIDEGFDTDRVYELLQIGQP